MDQYKHKGMQRDSVQDLLHYRHEKRIIVHNLMQNWRHRQLWR